MSVLWKLRYRLLRSKLRQLRRGKPKRKDKDMPPGYDCEYIDKCYDTHCRDCPACGRVK